MPVHHVDVTKRPISIPAGITPPGSPLWFEVRPNLTRGAVISGDILAALGKRRDVAGVGRNANEDIALALAWMSAYDITALVATEAQRLSVLVLKHLVKLANAAGLPLWLLHRTPRSDLFVRQLERHQAHPMRFGDVPLSANKPLATQFDRPTLGVRLPVAGFHNFVSTCRHALNNSDMSVVRARHLTVYERAIELFDRDGVEDDVIARAVTSSVVEGPQDDQLVVDIRAIQLALWHHDIYLKSDLPALLASPERQRESSEAVDQLLVAYRQPHRAVAVALSAQQVGVTDIAALRVRDAHPTGQITTRGGRTFQLGPHSSRAVHALLHQRNGQTTDREAPLLNVPARAISLALNEASTDLGIRVHGRRSERQVHPRRWLKTLGLVPNQLP